MKKVIAKITMVIVMYFIMFYYLNINIYSGMKTPWFSLDIVSSYFISFFIFLSWSLFYIKSNNRNDVLYYVLLIMNGLCYMVNKMEVLMILLYIIVLVAGYFTNDIYRVNKKMGYLSLVYLFFASYLLLSNQFIILIN